MGVDPVIQNPFSWEEKKNHFNFIQLLEEQMLVYVTGI